MVKQDVHEHRREHRKGKGDEATAEQQDSGDDLNEEYESEVVRHRQHSHVLNRKRVSGRRWWNEVKEAVKSEDGEHEPK